MTGFTNIVNGFDQSAIDALKTKADDLYINGTTPPSGWEETPLPDTAFDVTAYGVPNNGSDGTSALNTLASNTGVTNWYFPTGNYLIGRVDIPSHVVAVYGEGTITSVGYTGDTHPEGAFNLNNTGNNTADNFVMDGLTLTTGTGFDGGAAYGMVTLFQYGGSTSNIQIRNITFNTGNFNMCAVKGFSNSDDSMTHDGLKVFNNEVNSLPSIAFEFFNQSIADESNGFVNLICCNNLFNGAGGGMAISFAGIRQYFEIYNNDMSNISWAIECAECDKGIVYNNKAVELGDYAFVDSIKWGGPKSSPGVLAIYNNHFEARSGGDHYGNFMLYNGGPCEVYNNFNVGAFIIKQDNFDGLDTNIVMGNVHDNTFIHKYSSTWSTKAVEFQTITEGEFYNNEVYNELAGLYPIGSYTSTPVTLYDNDLYANGASSCILNDTQTGGTCDLNYSGAIPTGRAGAGLSDPANIGPQ